MQLSVKRNKIQIKGNYEHAIIKGVFKNGENFISKNKSSHWKRRILSTIDMVVKDINKPWVEIDNFQIKLQKGVYLVKAYAPAFAVSRHRIRFYNITDQETTVVGSSTYSDPVKNSHDQSIAHLSGIFEVSKETIFELQHISTLGFSHGGAFGLTMGGNIPGDKEEEVFTTVELTKFTT